MQDKTEQQMQEKDMCKKDIYQRVKEVLKNDCQSRKFQHA